MSKKPHSQKATTTGIVAALAASSCCIPPVIAAIAGIGGIAGSLSWMETYRPYLIAIAVIAIGYAWYNQLKPKKVDDCGCEIDRKPKWYQTKGFLIGISLFAALSIAFPYYSNVFFSDNTKTKTIIVQSENIAEAELNIEGMTCSGCATHVETDVNKLPGIIKVKASYKNANATVKFDKTKVSISEIKKAINKTGYTVIGMKQWL